MNERKGITLVALVVTIIILLILAAVTIALLMGPNGAITKAKQSKIASRYAQITDLKDIWEGNNKISVKLKEDPIELTDFTLELLEKNVIDLDEKDEIDTTKKLELEYGYVIHFNEESVVRVGDIVYYDPTVGVLDPNLLTYTSPKGSSKADGATDNSPGNGWQAQTFTATSDDCKWVVLYKRNGKIVLMSEDLKNPSENAYNGRFGVYGATGYLYAEQELHNICSIYGHRTWCSNRYNK